MRLRIIAAVTVPALVLACGGGGDSGTNTGPSPVLTSVTVSPATPSVAVGSTVTLSATPLDQNNQTLSNAGSPTFSSSNTAAATVNSSSGLVTGVAAGQSTITASFTAGSVTKSGTAVVTVVPASAAANVTATTTNQFDPANVTIPTGGVVTWTFQAVAHTVVFDTKPAGANVTDIGTRVNTTDSRTFTVAGVYNYHCSIHGTSMSGSITVH